VKTILNWAAFAACTPVLLGVSIFCLYCLGLTVPELLPSPSWRMTAWAAGELVLGLLAGGSVLAWFQHLPGADTLQRPISSFFRHG
jgi:hypothetical protein